MKMKMKTFSYTSYGNELEEDVNAFMDGVLVSQVAVVSHKERVFIHVFYYEKETLSEEASE